MSRLHVHMLGRFDIWEEDEGRGLRRHIDLPATARSQSLLAYLLLHRDSSLPREALAEMFWPGRPHARARRSLSTALWRIRRSFAPLDPLLYDRQSVQMAFPGEVWVDVEAFEAAVKAAATLQALEQALSAYGGDFLPGCYDDWVIRQRGHAQAVRQQALSKLIGGYEARGDDASALAAALQLLEMGACNEGAHRAAMRAYWRMGDRAAALAQYRRCEQALAKELGAGPSAETVALYQRLKEGSETLPMEGAGGMRASHPRAFLALRRAATAPDAPFVGREDVMARLMTRWRQAVDGRGGVVFLGGEAGVGKTRLLMHFAEQVHREDGYAIGASCYEFEQGQPYGPLVDVLRGAMAVADESLIRSLSSWQLAALARLAPELREGLPSDARRMVAAEAPQKHLLTALTHFLLGLARKRPTLVLLDDLHWAHEAVLSWLSLLARGIAREPLLVIGAYRVEEAVPGGMLARLTLQLETEGRAQRILLPRLSQQDVADWLQGLPPKTIAQIHHHTEGNPFFVLETMRSLVEQGRLHRENGVFQEMEEDIALPLPASVRQAIENRLSRLTPAARQGLGAAAVLGHAFDFDVWMRVWGREEAKALEVLDELLRHRFICEGKSPFVRDYEFEHHLVRETAYAALPRPRRKALHLAAARVLQTLRGEEPGAGAAIALHYLRGDAPQQALPWLLRAGDQAVAAAATLEALRFYKRALASLSRDESRRFERAVLARKIGETHFRRGEYEQAETHLLQALILLGKPFPAAGLPLHRAVSEALAHQTLHRLLPGAGRWERRAVTPDLGEEVACYTTLGWIYTLQSRYEEYLLVSLRALNRSEDAGYARGVAVAATALGFAADFMARFGLAEHFHQRAQAVAAQVEQPADAGFVAFGQAYHAYLLADENTMLTQARLAADNFRRVGDAHRWTLSRLLQAYVLGYRGRLDEVSRMGEELSTTGRELQDATAECAGECLAGLVGRWQGRWEEAAVHYRRAAELAASIPDYMSQVENLAGLARCLVRLERWEEAQKTLAQARETMLAHDVKGDAAGKFSVAALEAALWAAEHIPEARADWLTQAKAAMTEARKQAQAFRPAQPEVWRLCGRYEWLRGRPDAARAWWEKSLARAEALDHRLDWAVTALEMGIRLDAASLRAQGRARLAAAGAVGEVGFGV